MTYAATAFAALVLTAATAAAAQDDGQEAATTAPERIPWFGLLEPGTYSSSVLGPEIVITLEDQWVVANAPLRNVGFDLAPPSRGQVLIFTGFEGEVFTEPCVASEEPVGRFEAGRVVTAWLADPANRAPAEESPEAFWEFVMANPYLVVEEPVEVEVGGYRGLEADVVASVPEECLLRQTNLWPVGTVGPYILRDGVEARYTIVDVDGQLILIAAESAPGADHAALLARAEDVIATIEFGTG